MELGETRVARACHDWGGSQVCLRCDNIAEPFSPSKRTLTTSSACWTEKCPKPAYYLLYQPCCGRNKTFQVFKLARPRFLYSTDYELASVPNEFSFSQQRLTQCFDVDCISSIRSRSSHLQERSCNFAWTRVIYTRVGYGPTSKSSRRELATFWF